jgi:nucleotidyltransferase substrate binding protein (TIGR01987 family)
MDEGPVLELDFTPLERAVERLAEGLERHRREADDAQLRDGLIQRFEFTYELCHRMLRRYLALTAPDPDDVARADFAVLVRTGSDRGLLAGDWTAWRVYREMRSRTSHTYDEESSLRVVEGIPAFLEEARHLLDRLRERLSR